MPGGLLRDRLAEPGSEGRQPAQRQTADREQDPHQAEFPGLPVQLVLVHGGVPVEQDARAREQGRLHARVTGDVERRPGDGVGGEHGQTGQEQPGVGHRGERQQPLEMALLPAHERAQHGRERPEGQQRVGEGGVRDAARAREDRPVDPADPVHPQLHHDAGQQHAHRRGGDRVRVGQPEVERHRGRLHQQTRRHQDERDEYEGVRRARVQRLPELGEAQLPGARVQQRDAQQHAVGAEGVHHAEGQRPLERLRLLHPEAGQGVRDDAHQLEEDERVEQVPGQREAAHARLEEQDQRREGAGVAARRLLEVTPGVDQDGHHQQRDQRREPGTQRIAHQHDAHALAPHRVPAAHPFHGTARGVSRQDQRQYGGGGGEGAAQDV